MSAEPLVDSSQQPQQPFVHLHVHTEYSLLDGLSKVDKLVAHAKELGMTSLAISDHGAMHGVVSFYRACKNAEIKPIIGMEGYLAKKDMRIHDQSEKSPYHLLLLARNEIGYKNLLKIASAAQLEGFYMRPRIDRDFLAHHADGLICTSGCLAAEIPRMIEDGKDDEALRTIGLYQDMFGKENFFLELQHHDIPQLRTLNKWLFDHREHAKVPLLATNDVHYVRYQDYDAHDTLLCIQTGAHKTEEKRMRMADPTYYLRSPAEMWDLFGDAPEALLNTVKVAEMCDVSAFFDQKGYHLPIFPVPEGFNEETYLRHLAERGLRWRYGEKADQPIYKDRLDYELGVIHKMGFDTYFLIVWDLCQFARYADIWWNVRGSGAGSVTAYSLGITNIDPIANNLIFERFLNPGRVSMPDIDMDFPDDRRMEMIDYASHKYGTDKVAAIITFGTLKARAAIKDVGRVLEYALPEVNGLTQLVPQIPSRPVSLSDCLGDDEDKAVPELKQMYANDARIRKLLDTARTVEGVARNAGTHAAGVIIGDKPLVEYLPLHRPIGDTTVSQVTQFPMEICESIGLLKVDFLGLSTLTIMRKACELIEKYNGIKFSMDNIPYRPDPTDPEVTRRVEALFELMGRGETTGVFQLESDGMKKMLVQMKPKTFEHVIAAISLYRPGPMDLIPLFIRRMHGQETVVYHHEKLEPVLKETYGICVYQEQIQQIAAQLFGYSLGDADLMRRAVSKKKKKDLEQHKTIFMERGPDNGVSKDVAEKIFGEIEFFAAYGFNKCVVADTQIVDAATGRLVRVGDLALGKVQVTQTITCDTDTLRLKAADITAVMTNGVKPVFRLTTRLGRQIEATANHPFYTFSGWRILGELTAGDKIAVPRRIPIEGSRVWPDYKVITLGHLLAEGNLCHPHGLYYYTSDDEQWQDYVANLERFDNTRASTHRRRNNMHDVYSKKIVPTRPNGVVVWVEELGLRYTDSYTKFIPDEVFELTNRQIALLIARMWEGDGNITEKNRFLYYATSSQRMVHQLQHLFSRLGIVCRVRRVEFKYRGGVKTGFQLHVHGNDNLQKFAEIIGCHFVSQLRREKLARMVLENPEAFGTKDVIPVEVKHIVRREKAAQYDSWAVVAQKAGVAPREFNGPAHGTKSGFTHAVIGRLAEYFDCDELRKYVDNDVLWDDIASIEYVGEQPTYDLTIPGTHNFVANDIIVHNSHAADYAVLTCQTAYLKAHYPEEYYTALLSVQRDVIADVALFTSDCRRFGIPILPPNVNGSDLDFTIEKRPDGKRGIRYGLAAIKNAGEKALQVILDARNSGGRFRDITDFCRRVDLRQVGKRAIESLIKAGAFDVLEEQEPDRDALLLSLERLVKYSGDHHHAKEIGQISLFGDSGIGDDLTLPTVPAEKKSDNRERLKWEKELIGLYVSPHPLTDPEIADKIQHVPNIQFSDTLRRDSEALQDHAVTVIGLVVGIRNITTKNNDTMAIVSLEDITGNVDCVFFPRTWRKYEEIVQPEQVIVVRGKADASRGDVQVIAENANNNLDVSWAADAPGYHPAPRADYAPPQFSAPDDPMSSFSEDDSTPPDEDPGYVPLDSDAPPEDIPPVMPQNGNGNGHRKSMTPAEPAIPATEPIPQNGHIAEREEPPVEVEEETAEGSHLPQMITIVIRLSDDPKKDRTRLEKLKHELTQYPGEDKFRFLLDDSARTQKIYTMDFPDESTCYGQDVIKLLDSKIKKNLVHSYKVDPLPETHIQE